MLGTGWLTLTTAGAAEGAAVNLADTKGPPGMTAAVALLGRAASLTAYARTHESAPAMLAALEMLGRVRPQADPLRLGPKTSAALPGAADGPAAPKQGAGATLEVDDLLAEAKGWAKDNAPLVALLEQQAALAKAGPGGTLGATGGPVSHRDRVQKRTTDTYTLRFRGGERARVVVIGDGDTDLDLIVEDENGNVVGRDVDLTDDCVVEWSPRWTGTFRVRVINNGNVFNNYLLLTN